MEIRLVAPDTGAQPGELSPADDSGPRELLRYRSASFFEEYSIFLSFLHLLASSSLLS